MNTTLNSFEAALLAELRQQVAEHPAPVSVPTSARRRRSRRFRLATATALTGAVATAIVAVGIVSSGGSPAYAVEVAGDGDVVVTVHRLDDAEGLEAALRAQGIDADVSYDADGTEGVIGIEGDPLPGPAGPPEHSKGEGEQGLSAEAEPDAGAAPQHSGAAPAPADHPCGMGEEPATLRRDGTDWVLRIPAGSPLQDRHVDIGTEPDGALFVAYEGDQPGSMCGLMQAPARS